MDDSVEASAANPEAGKADWQQWETSPMRKLRERGDGMNLVREQSRPRTSCDPWGTICDPVAFTPSLNSRTVPGPVVDVESLPPNARRQKTKRRRVGEA